MCGIAGFYGFRDDNLIQKFSSQLTHRGPDGEGLFIDDKVTLLNRRLAIIDVKGGDQPIYNEDGSIVVVYNGEIYNYQELRELLEKKGHVFKTKSDTEVIVHGYEEWGDDAFDRCNGMFSVALYDKRRDRMILARDHFGIKPLYYSFKSNNPADSVTRDTGQIVFSSEIKPIFYSGLVKQRPNDRIIYRYLKYRIHDDLRETFFEGIYKLLPGEMMIIERSTFNIKRYSNLQKELLETKQKLQQLTTKDVETFRKELIKAVKYRLISEVPVGTCLSGGLDSSTVVSIVNSLLQKHVKESQSLGKNQKTFSAVFPGSVNDEERYIDSLLHSSKKIKSYKVFPKPEEFFQDIQDFIRTQEEPTISTGPYAQYKVMQKAHKEVTVLLDGQGADEMMAGYLPYYFVYLKQLVKEKKIHVLLKEVLGSIDVLLKYLLLNRKKTVDLFLNEKFEKKYRGERFKVVNDNLKQRLIEDIFSNSLQSLLRYEDKNAMRFSIEGRVPFLDFKLLKFIFSLPDEAIISSGWNKYILREATKGLLPPLINMRRNKIGFTTPEQEWFMRMKNRIYSVFMSESFMKRKYFNQSAVVNSFQEFIEGKNEDTLVFWRLLNVELWMREFFPERSHKVHKVIKSIKSDTEPNEGKKLAVRVEGKTYLRFPIKTELFQKGDDYAKKISKEISKHIVKLLNVHSVDKNKKWFVVISEKIVAIAQGRSYFIWDIRPGMMAKVLSSFVTKTPFGIGLGSPWTMQIAIDEVGSLRILSASIISALAKPFGIKGMFYLIAGETVRSIDGPTEYSLYPSNVSAKLGPKLPEKAAREIQSNIEHETLNMKQKSNFLGAVIIDANDLGRNVLGNSTKLSNSLIEEMFKGNPMGQGSEQTPIVIVFEA